MLKQPHRRLRAGTMPTPNLDITSLCTALRCCLTQTRWKSGIAYALVNLPDSIQWRGTSLFCFPRCYVKQISIKRTENCCSNGIASLSRRWRFITPYRSGNLVSLRRDNYTLITMGTWYATRTVILEPLFTLLSHNVLILFLILITFIFTTFVLYHLYLKNIKLFISFCKYFFIISKTNSIL